MTRKNQLDVVVRFHDAKRLPELERCIFSLVGQNYRPLHIILVAQRFSETDLAEVRARLAPLLACEDAPTLEVLNWEHPEPVDARSALINLGIRAGRGRYLAFLDYDDVLYPEAYDLLVSQLQAGEAGIAFGRVRLVQLEVHSTFFRPKATLPYFEGSTLSDLFRGNFCPIHSYVIDRTRIPEQFLFFEPNLLLEEDYDFILRICAQFPSDFALVGTEIGEYYFKTDGSNTHTAGGRPPSWQAQYERAAAFVEQRRRSTPIAAPVQRALGIAPPNPDLSIRDFLDRAA
ncbi:glycosyltransferase family A protein [Microvirga sp. GCM10011540]|uniref:glycosyltransferase family A protein n=1 Tax=Microvirga sp. GCM10011540 TaxID=3317338 RepID=UPI003621CD21